MKKHSAKDISFESTVGAFEDVLEALEYLLAIVDGKHLLADMYMLKGEVEDINTGGKRRTMPILKSYSRILSLADKQEGEYFYAQLERQAYYWNGIELLVLG